MDMYFLGLILYKHIVSTSTLPHPCIIQGERYRNQLENVMSLKAQEKA